MGERKVRPDTAAIPEVSRGIQHSQPGSPDRHVLPRLYLYAASHRFMETVRFFIVAQPIDSLPHPHARVNAGTPEHAALSR